MNHKIASQLPKILIFHPHISEPRALGTVFAHTFQTTKNHSTLSCVSTEQEDFFITMKDADIDSPY